MTDSRCDRAKRPFSGMVRGVVRPAICAGPIGTRTNVEDAVWEFSPLLERRDDVLSAERALIIAERDALISDLRTLTANQSAIRAGHMPVTENPLLAYQIDACHRHIDRLNDLLGSETADHGSTLDGSRTVVGRREQA